MTQGAALKIDDNHMTGLYTIFVHPEIKYHAIAANARSIQCELVDYKQRECRLKMYEVFL